MPGCGDHLGDSRCLSQRRSSDSLIRPTRLPNAGSAVLARIAVAQQQNARTDPAGPRMAHHRNDQAYFAGNLRRTRAKGRVRDTALRPEQGDRQTCAALVRSRCTEFSGKPRRCCPAHKRSRDHRRYHIGHGRSGRRSRAGLGAHPGHHERRITDGDSNSLAGLARDRSHPRTRAIDRCCAATDGARSVPNISPSLPIDGAFHDRAGRWRARSASRAGQGAPRRPDPAAS